VPEGRTKPWGTGHAVRAARDLVKEPFAVINADDFYGRDSYRSAAEFLTATPSETGGSNYAMVGYPLENTLSDHGEVNRGICSRFAANFLTSVEEYVNISRDSDGVVRGTALNGTRLPIEDGTPVSMNFWAFTPDFFTHLEAEFTDFLNHQGQGGKTECYIPTVVDALIRSKKATCNVLETNSHWFGVTYPEDKAHVVASIQKLIDAGEYPSSLR
jgi:NDP-sugar pyrophosphorylase family protein